MFPCCATRAALPSGAVDGGKQGRNLWDDLRATLLLRTPASRCGADSLSSVQGEDRSRAGKYASSPRGYFFNIGGTGGLF
ncbi:hypothetical protein KDJ56_02070 [Brevibacillus composti]|uniref:Uncharacterized protein n=1 Tax=Brevibacillus composti TaxID=2796470 RepID=A0A7T5ELK0_9BACL|nr:hypothetical protein [Brevibacillus composti]QQE74795.1 hypothetical protein JD108_02070 [Brevibacillus composti]QUO41880.1 hypothetical protein KDJ56_02070 [Brevibacillus composti]